LEAITQTMGLPAQWLTASASVWKSLREVTPLGGGVTDCADAASGAKEVALSAPNSERTNRPDLPFLETTRQRI
jgi:hypothetical protein